MPLINPIDATINTLAGIKPLRDALRRFTDARRIPDFESIVRTAVQRFELRRSLIGGDRLEGTTLLEIGSGRDACLGLLLLGAGAARVVNVEIDSYGFIDDEALYRALHRVSPYPVMSWIEARRSGRLQIHNGVSATRLPCADASMDVTLSIAVLEHVRGEDMAGVARELYRVTKRGGIGFHRIDLVDHYHRRTDPHRMLRYPAWAHEAMYSNRASYSNRLRMHEFSRIFVQAGFPSPEFDDVRLIPDTRNQSLRHEAECMMLLKKHVDAVRVAA